MTETFETIIIATFENEDDAQQAIEELKNANRTQLINVQDIASIHINAQGNVELRERGGAVVGAGAKAAGAAGTLFGAVLEAAVNLVGSTVILALTGASALAETLADRLRGVGFDDAQLADVAGSVQRGGVAVVTVAGENSMEMINQLMSKAGGVVTASSSQADTDPQSIPIDEEDEEVADQETEEDDE